ncbi:MAG: magnesium-translocating P-type ATPase [Erysipelothrix sp.]|nr:magnesium-translocating P-type ATPase [Erysipelothrix sp.]
MISLEDKKSWSFSTKQALYEYDTSLNGLSQQEVTTRQKQFGYNILSTKSKATPFLLFINQLNNPILMILIVAITISSLTGAFTDSLIILAIVLASVVLSFIQEYRANDVISKLTQKIQQQSRVIRNNQPVTIASTQLVIGDIVVLSAGSLIPADGLVLECDDFLVNQSSLTGEALPIEKNTIPSNPETVLANRQNCVYAGTTVISGSATIVVTAIGNKTELGQIAKSLSSRPLENDFQKGIRHFGYLLTKIMVFLAILVFVINFLAKRPLIDSLLFSVALAVGITPQLLPAIINITLSSGSRLMAKSGVIVRHLSAIENFGSMDILYTDKTGTLTEGVLKLDEALDAKGNPSLSVFRYAYLNAYFQTGMVNALDQAILSKQTLEVSSISKQDEIPYDFKRKRLSIIINQQQSCNMITKGALEKVLQQCQHIQINDRVAALQPEDRDSIYERMKSYSDQGYRVLGVACKEVEKKQQYPVSDESDLIFCGFLLFYDPPKEEVIEIINDLNRLGVDLRIITGDNQWVALHTAKTIQLTVKSVLNGQDLNQLSDDELLNRIDAISLFVDVDPSQKERIILASKKRNHVVGYMGDGINDALALRAADVSISVNTAVDVAKEAADFVLLEKSLAVLKQGIILGRKTFANTLKYVYITTSANFGNMFSMAGAVLFLPFLPLLPKQILLINFLSDIPALMLASDAVDDDMIAQPHRWNIHFIRDFMMTFGLISSLFDYLTFVVLFFGMRANQTLFQSSWFTVSIFTELMVLLVMRTQKPFFKSKPAPLLLLTSLIVAVVTILLPYTPFQTLFNLQPIDLGLLLILLIITGLYILTTEIVKVWFYKRHRL